MRRPALLVGFSSLTLACFVACGGMVVVEDDGATSASADASAPRRDAGSPPEFEPEPPGPPKPRPPGKPGEPYEPSEPPKPATCPGGVVPTDPVCGASSADVQVYLPPPYWSPDSRRSSCARPAPRCTEPTDAGFSQRTMTLRGSLIDCTGAPLANTVVRTRMGKDDAEHAPSDQCEVSTTTDAAGQFELDVPGGWDYDFGFGWVDLYVETSKGVADVMIGYPSGCPVQRCGIVIP